MSHPVASLSLDLDNLWSYLKTHGDEGWESFPGYLETVVPRILDVLNDLNLRCTFFVVGQDAALPKNTEVLRSIVDAGHEIGNHSWSHDPWFHLFDAKQLSNEVLASELAIMTATGQKPIGWRSPGFSLSDDLLRFLAGHGYQYDASVFPSCTGPLARLYYFATSGLNRGERKKRSNLYGSWKDGFQSLNPFQREWNDGSSLLEVPVTTCPAIRTPIHASYLQFLAKFAEPAANCYFRTALRLCKFRKIAPSFLLHPTDFLGKEDSPELAGFFPAMDQPADVKMRRINRFLSDFANRFEVLPMGEFAEHHVGQKFSKTAKKETRNKKHPTPIAVS
ncbi:MAG: polysaccharide deacetylase family protein [Verrucomicrobiales bacterium]|nr:polysaccharide deacetylase family protein [Verrucomicrobiales bacterium]